MSNEHLTVENLESAIETLARMGLTPGQVYGYEMAKVIAAEVEEHNEEAAEEAKDDGSVFEPETFNDHVNMWREERDIVRGVGHDAIAEAAALAHLFPTSAKYAAA